MRLRHYRGAPRGRATRAWPSTTTLVNRSVASSTSPTASTRAPRIKSAPACDRALDNIRAHKGVLPLKIESGCDTRWTIVERPRARCPAMAQGRRCACPSRTAFAGGSGCSSPRDHRKRHSRQLTRNRLTAAMLATAKHRGRRILRGLDKDHVLSIADYALDPSSTSTSSSPIRPILFIVPNPTSVYNARFFWFGQLYPVPAIRQAEATCLPSHASDASTPLPCKLDLQPRCRCARGSHRRTVILLNETFNRRFHEDVRSAALGVPLHDRPHAVRRSIRALGLVQR